MEYTDWYGCYKESWGKRLSPLSYSHPAKGAYGLAQRIYEYGIARGWFGPGDTILDPFAGIGGFAFHAMQHGMHFVGVELEPNFVDLGQGCDCTGIGKEDWIRYQGRWKRMRYEGRHWCPQCINEVGRVVGERPQTLSRRRLVRRTRISELAAIVGREPKLYDDMPLPPWDSRRVQLGMFATKLSTSYTRDSGKIPHTVPHHYRGNVEIWADQGMLGSAIIVRGDSRRLMDAMREASSCVSSPPFGTSDNRGAAKMPDDYFVRPDGSPFGEGRAIRGTVESPDNLGNLPATEEGWDAVIASPPFQSTQGKGGETKGFHSYDGDEAYNRCKRDYVIPDADGQLATMPEGDVEAAISSPPFLAQSGGTNVTSKTGPLADESLLERHSAGNVAAKGYGDADGQLGVMPEGVLSLPDMSSEEAESFKRAWENAAAERNLRDIAVVSSPPYTASLASDDPDKRGGLFRDPKRRSDKTLTAEYGDSDGQLGTMPEGNVEVVVASPPYEGSMDSEKSGIDWTKMKEADGSIRDMTDEPYQALRPGAGAEMRYGQTEGQLGQEQAETFWSAARQIVDQTYRVLLPGAYAIFVCKRFVRDKKIVEFSQQWRQLCESCGFELVEWIRAWLIEDKGAQYTLTGELEKRTVSRFSFFRRLHVKKYPHLAIEWEDVICLRKPLP